MNIKATLSVAAASAVLTMGLAGCNNGGTASSAAPVASSPSAAAGSSHSGAGTSQTQTQGGAGASTTGGTSGSASSGSMSSGSTTSRSAASGGAMTTSATAAKTTAGCSTQTATQAAQKAEHAIPQFADWAWVVQPGDNHYDRCADLSYIVLSINGTASSPNQIALYHRGVYLGTATKTAYGFHPVVTRTAPNAINVRYLYIKGNECTACASGHAVANFRWSDAAQKVVMTGSVPPQQN